MPAVLTPFDPAVHPRLAGSVPAPELGAAEVVYITRKTAPEWAALQERAGSGGAAFIRTVVSAVVCEADGELVFAPDDPAVLDLPAALANRILAAALEAAELAFAADVRSIRTLTRGTAPNHN